jgi:threonine/homoserine/homoserine lactone efflux protein
VITLDDLLAFWLFAVVATTSPGPDNMMGLAASARVGFLRRIPLVLGIAAGISLLVISVGLGLGALFESLPWLHNSLRVAGSVYLLYLA